ncbi:MAG: alpha/beta hydrolase [Thermoguttaceae bacterium]|nr:alpha/beta hydrolase [Thermoguttaceae bacterium]
MNLKSILSAFLLLLFAAFLGAKEETIGDIWDGAADLPVPLHVRIPEKPCAEPMPALVICPGGGYAMRCIEPEGFGIAQWLNRNGIAGFVLEYRLPKGQKEVPLSDAQRAIAWVRAHAGEYGIDPQKIGIIGFSAGGHLASSAAVHFGFGDPESEDPIGAASYRPDFAVLIYPVITMQSGLTHEGTRRELLGDSPSETDIDFFSSEKQITPQTPPVFLAHAQDDTVVPPENSQMFADRMKELGRPCVYLKLESGGHGLNGYQGESWDKWQSEAIDWIKRL